MAQTAVKNGRRSCTRHKQLLKRPTIVYEAQTAVKKTDDRLRGTNGRKKVGDRVQSTNG